MLAELSGCFQEMRSGNAVGPRNILDPDRLVRMQGAIDQRAQRVIRIRRQSDRVSPGQSALKWQFTYHF